MTQIRLPDGRTIALKDLKNRVTNRESINLRTRRRHKSRPAVLKYSIVERVWIATHSIQEIQERYQIDEEAARNIKYQTVYMLKKHQVDPDQIQAKLDQDQD